jgi:hypothetical protein
MSKSTSDVLCAFLGRAGPACEQSPETLPSLSCAEPESADTTSKRAPEQGAVPDVRDHVFSRELVIPKSRFRDAVADTLQTALGNAPSDVGDHLLGSAR